MTNVLRWLGKLGATTRWVIWLVFSGAWTVALLTPHPVHIAHAVLPDDNAFYFGKTLHVAAYAFLVVLTSWLLVTNRVRWMLLACLSFHAFATEFLQNYVPERSGSLRDVGLDHLGLVLGLLLTFPWWWRKSGAYAHHPEA
jgi:VanZ family protein